MLPDIILHGIRQGRELGDEMAVLTGIANVKHQGGAIGIFTDGKLMESSSVYHQALLLALVPFHNEIYQRPASNTL